MPGVFRRPITWVKSTVHALRDVDLDIFEPNSSCCWVHRARENSTLLNILGGLDNPSSGEVRWRDHNLVGAGDIQLTRCRREHVGFVFQLYNLMLSLTVLENVALINEIAEKPLDPLEVLTLVGLEQRIGHFPSQLSSGEQQRVAVATPSSNRRMCCYAMSPPAR
jgi:putative ABC transport system ATP-binding protein